MRSPRQPRSSGPASAAHATRTYGEAPPRLRVARGRSSGDLVVLGRITPEGSARLTGHVDGRFARDRDPAHDTALLPVVVDRVVLGGPVVPDRHVTFTPLPAHRVLETHNDVLEEVLQRRRLGRAEALNLLGEASQKERP